jgi:regulator of protease activity HflC (stomatin/prohibitin superfamily)
MGTIVAFFIVVVLFLFVFAAATVKVVRPWEKGIIERLGRYHRTAESGLKVIIPLFDTMFKIDMREAVIEVPPQEVITKDNVVVTVDAVVYTEVTDPVKVRYNIQNFYLATIKLAQTNLRNLVGDMSLDESLTSRDSINVHLREILDTATDKWGVRITRVELQRIDPPQDVTASMHRQMKAERERRATVLEADGQREAAIKTAEGRKQAAILESEGKAQAIRMVADAEKYQKIAIAAGESEAIMNVYKAIHEGNPTNDLIAIKYLEALGQVAQGQATKIFMPLETTGVMGSIAGIAELLKDQIAKKKDG